MQKRNGRRGDNFVLRLTPDERAALERMRDETAGPRALGPWMLWAVRCAFKPVLPRRSDALELTPERRAMNRKKVILDLCAGTGAWSDPYRLAGYDVRRYTLPEHDVRTMPAPCDRIHGVLCAPPCAEFSIAKNGRPRNVRAELETVSACIRIVIACRPVWWALENPVGLLSRYLGTPRDVFEPFEFGDPHTKPTALWGEFTIPERGPYVEPLGSAMDRSTAEERAITPDGFAHAFFRANP